MHNTVDYRMLEHAAEADEGHAPIFQFDATGKRLKDQRLPLHCKTCGSTDVRWRLQGGTWTLFSTQPGVLHVCDTNEDFE